MIATSSRFSVRRTTSSGDSEEGSVSGFCGGGSVTPVWTPFAAGAVKAAGFYMWIVDIIGNHQGDYVAKDWWGYYIWHNPPC